MTNTLVSWAINWLIARYTDSKLRAADIDRVKRLVIDLETKAISKAIKGERARALILEIASDLSEDVVDWVVKTLLYLIRVLGVAK